MKRRGEQHALHGWRFILRALKFGFQGPQAFQAQATIELGLNPLARIITQGDAGTIAVSDIGGIALEGGAAAGTGFFLHDEEESVEKTGPKSDQTQPGRQALTVIKYS